MEKSIKIFKILSGAPIILPKGNKDKAQIISLCNLIIDGVDELGDIEHSNDWDLSVSIHLNNGDIKNSFPGYPSILWGHLSSDEQMEGLLYIEEGGEALNIMIMEDGIDGAEKEILIPLKDISAIHYNS